ncbi:MAG: hypothetical protein ABGW69_03440, partial [Nanoarchaeota archaeon]
AHSLYLYLETLPSQKNNNDIIFVHYGDLIYNCPEAIKDYKKAVEEMNRNRDIDIIFFARPVYEKSETKRLGIFIVERNNTGLYKAKRIIEKPQDEYLIEKLAIRKNNDENYWLANAGSYLLRVSTSLKEAIKRGIENVERGEMKEAVFSKIVDSLLQNNSINIKVYPLSKPECFEDLGTFKIWIDHWYRKFNY